MNVVGKVGSLITQGVYSVATPFHPFGGAVDIIVVQQQDGTFRSTPWYVQFGKFQGVLKGAEKVVRINVNGVEADFHMYLDNSGEAYFVREADSSKDIEKSEAATDDREGALEHSLSVDNSKCSLNNDNGENFRLQSTLSDPGILRDDYSTFRPDVLERTDSDVCRFYDFQDDQSFDGELSPEYGSSRYDNLDGADNFVEAQGSDSEMVLVSVDGHILTAPILSSEQNTENVQLVTPQFHLGPGEGNGFCEGDTKFTVSENAWDPEFITDLDASSNKVESVVASCENGLVEKCKDEELAREHQDRDTCNNLSEAGHDVEINDMHASESCKEFDESAIKSPEHGSTDWKSVEYEDTHNLDPNKVSNKDAHEGHGVEDAHHSEDQNEEKEQAHQDHHSDAEDVSPSVKKDKFQSCLDLTAAAIGETSQGDDSTLKVREQLPEEIPVQKVDLSSDRVVTGMNIGNAGEDKADNESSPSASSKTVLSSQESENIKKANTGIKDMNSECMPTGNASLNEEDRVRLDALSEIANNSRDKDFTENELGRSENPHSSSEQEQASFKLGKASAMNDLTGGDFTETDSNRSEVLKSHSSSEHEQANLNLALEISLCGHLLRPGMGLVAANEVFNSHRVSEKEFKSTAVSVIKNENLVIRLKEKYFLWDQAAHIVLGITAFGLDLSIDSKDAIQVEQEVTPKLVENDPGSTSGRRWRLWPIAFRRVKTIQHTNSSSSEEVFVDSESVSQNPSVHLTPTSQSGTPRSATKSPLKRIVRTNIPTNEQIESLNLKDGQNNVTFSFSTRVLGVQQVEAHIYLWKWNARIVISDVDGTITKSDVLGQFMPLVGKDWSQSGVARLFSAIKENGYQLLFLSARAIVQAYLTKSFLFNLKQDGKTLPNGPVVISPNGLFPSLFREVIRRAPHEFKIACLEDIKALFPPDYNPFYAGFGNRDTDELTYRKLGIPKGKIFIINPKGEVAINHRIDVKSYTSLHTLVHDMFPPTSMVEQEDYNSWNYWKMPVIDIDE